MKLRVQVAITALSGTQTAKILCSSWNNVWSQFDDDSADISRSNKGWNNWRNPPPDSNFDAHVYARKPKTMLLNCRDCSCNQLSRHQTASVDLFKNVKKFNAVHVCLENVNCKESVASLWRRYTCTQPGCLSFLWNVVILDGSRLLIHFFSSFRLNPFSCAVPILLEPFVICPYRSWTSFCDLWWSGKVYTDSSAIQFRVIHVVDCSHSVFCQFKLNKSRRFIIYQMNGFDLPESSMFACFIIHWDWNSNDVAERNECQGQVLLIHFIAKASDIHSAFSIVREVSRKCHMKQPREKLEDKTDGGS